MILNECVCVCTVLICVSMQVGGKRLWGPEADIRYLPLFSTIFHSHGTWSLLLWLGWPVNEPQELLVYKVASLKCWGYRNVQQTQLLLEC